jgi:hypothetical protein
MIFLEKFMKKNKIKKIKVEDLLLYINLASEIIMESEKDGFDLIDTDWGELLYLCVSKFHCELNDIIHNKGGYTINESEE